MGVFYWFSSFFLWYLDSIGRGRVVWVKIRVKFWRIKKKNELFNRKSIVFYYWISRFKKIIFLILEKIKYSFFKNLYF